MGSRRGWGEDGIFFEHTGLCRDPDRHRNCPGRWRGVVSLGFGPDGKRIRRKVSGKTRAVVQERLKALHSDLDSGVKASPNYTVRRAAQDWLTGGLEGRSAKTVKKNENVLAPILTVIGSRRLRELTADDVRQALTAMAGRYSTAAVAMGHNALTRAIRHAEGRDLVGRNVAALVDTPKGQAGRPSKSLTLDQASALLTAAQGTRMHAYIALCLATGIRTEEARALRWEHVSFGDPKAARRRGQRGGVAVRPGPRRHQNREITPHPALRHMAVDALRLPETPGPGPAHRRGTVGDRVWCSPPGPVPPWTPPTSAASSERPAGLGHRAGLDPRELRHSFVSLMSSTGVPVEEIARLAGHTAPAPPKLFITPNYAPSSPPAPKSWTPSSNPSRRTGPRRTTAHGR